MVNDLSITIVFYNGDANLEQALREARAVCNNIVIVDNHSTDEDSLAILSKAEEWDGVTVIRNSRNEGVAYALNQGLDYADTQGKKYLLTLDQDSILTGESIQKLRSALDPNKRIVSVGPFYGEERTHNACDLEARFLITSGNMVSVSVMKQLGGYWDDLFIDCVDIDQSFNIAKSGYRQLKVGGTYMKHSIGVPDTSRALGIKHFSHEPNRYYFMYRINVLIYKKYWKSLPFDCLKLFASLVFKTCALVLFENDKLRKLTAARKGIGEALSHA